MNKLGTKIRLIKLPPVHNGWTLPICVGDKGIIVGIFPGAHIDETDLTIVEFKSGSRIVLADENFEVIP